MEKIYSPLKTLRVAGLLLFLLSSQFLFSQIVQTFSYTAASQSFVIPPCVSTVTLEAWGAQGGSGWSSNTNYGGYAKGVYTVNAGDVLNVYVGSQPTNTLGGFNGGGAGEGSGYGGGGASDIRLNGTALANRIIVAGGGGGASYWSGEEVVGGVGGGLTGGNGSRTNYATNQGGTGGGQAPGGFGTCTTFSVTSMAGGLGFGGSPAGAGCGCDGYGGGGGYYGGAGSGNCRGGGGGSGFLLPTATGTLFTSGTTIGHGHVTISYFTNGAGVIVNASSTLLCSGASATLAASNVPSYTWSPGASNASSIVVSPSSNTSYTVQGTNTLGCISTAVINLTVSGGVPSLSVASSAATVCPNNTVMLTASGALTYTWSNSITNAVSFTPAATAIYTVSGTNGCGTSTSAIGITVTPLPVTANASSTLVCSGATATLSAGGATTYTWMPGSNTNTNYIVSPASNTTYTVSGRTGVCSGSTTIVVSTKPNPTLSIAASSSAVCNGNSANLTVSGNALTYTWSVGNQTGTSISVTPSTTTLYSVIGTNSVNCTSGSSQVILVFANPTVNAAISNPVVCSGSQATLTANGANTYLWSTTDNTPVVIVNPTASTTYSVTGTDNNNCSGTATVSVSVFIPTLSVSAGTAICAGSNAVISASGADTYLWTNNGSTFPSITVSPSVTTTYSVTGSVTDPVSNISCNAGNSILVTVNPNPSITATANHTIICLGNSAVLTGNGAGASGSYTWTGGAGAVQSVSMSVTPITNQTYTITGVDGNGCRGAGTLLIQVSPCAGINSISSTDPGLLIYPNPSSGEFTISSTQAITLFISNELGQQVRTITLNGSSEVKVNNLANGVYFISGHNENGSVKQKIIIAE